MDSRKFIQNNMHGINVSNRLLHFMVRNAQPEMFSTGNVKQFFYLIA